MASAISPKRVSFAEEWYLEKKIWVVGKLTVTRASLLLGHLSREGYEAYMH